MGYEESAIACLIITAMNIFVRPRKLGIVTGADGTIKLFAGLGPHPRRCVHLLEPAARPQAAQGRYPLAGSGPGRRGAEQEQHPGRDEAQASGNTSAPGSGWCGWWTPGRRRCACTRRWSSRSSSKRVNRSTAAMSCQDSPCRWKNSSRSRGRDGPRRSIPRPSIDGGWPRSISLGIAGQLGGAGAAEAPLSGSMAIPAQ